MTDRSQQTSNSTVEDANRIHGVGPGKYLLLRCRIIPTVTATFHPPQMSKHGREKVLSNTVSQELKRRLKSQGLGVKGPSPALCCHGRPVAEGGFPNRLKVNTTLGYSRVKWNNRRRRLRKRSGGGHLREDDMAPSFGATKNNGV